MFTFLVCGVGFDHKLVRDMNTIEVDEEDDLPIRPIPLAKREAVEM